MKATAAALLSALAAFLRGFVGIPADADACAGRDHPRVGHLHGEPGDARVTAASARAALTARAARRPNCC